jgi:hypothetical protein
VYDAAMAVLILFGAIFSAALYWFGYLYWAGLAFGVALGIAAHRHIYGPHDD